MGKDNHLFPKLTDGQKAKMREDIEKSFDDIKSEEVKEQYDYNSMCSMMGYNPFDVTMIGPWTLNEYFDMIGLKLDKFLRGDGSAKLAKVMEDKGAIPLAFNKDW